MQKKLGKTKGRKKRVVKKKKQPRLKNLARDIKKIEDELIELKWVDELNTNSGTPITNAGYGFTVNNFAEGNTVNTRVGQRIYMTSLQLKYSLYINTANLGTQITRILVVLDKAHNGNLSSFDAAPLGEAGLLDNTTIAAPSLMPRAYVMRYRYRVLYDKIHVLNPHWENATGTAVLQCGLHVTKNIRLGVNATYSDATSSIASLLKNAISLFAITDSSSNGPTVQIATRLYFKDA